MSRGSHKAPPLSHWRAIRAEGEVLQQSVAGVRQVLLIHDVGAIEDALRGVTEDYHRDAFGHPRTDEIAGRGPSAVVQATPTSTSSHVNSVISRRRQPE